MRNCGIIVPRWETEFHETCPEQCECIRPHLHNDGIHVFRKSNGRLVEWQDDDKCECCTPGDDSQCYTYGEIDEARLAELNAETPNTTKQ